MAPRGADTRARLIDATTEVVGRVGYARATTRLIADAAGVAEGTIYRHFPDKQHLFFAAIVERNAPVLEWMSRLPGLAGTATVRENLTASLLQLSQLRDEVLPLELSVLSDPDLARERREALREMGDGLPPGPPELIAAYLAAEQAEGRVRRDVDTDRAALVILSTLLGSAMLPEVSAGRVLADPTSLVADMVDLLLVGLQPS